VPKESVFTVKLETELRDAFVAEAAAIHQPASQLVREFMREFIRSRKEQREHDAWFRREVEKALKDKSPLIPHEEVMRQMDEVIARAAARKKSA
jgi:predicted transcriptional regulator